MSCVCVFGYNFAVTNQADSPDQGQRLSLTPGVKLKPLQERSDRRRRLTRSDAGVLQKYAVVTAQHCVTIADGKPATLYKPDLPVGMRPLPWRTPPLNPALLGT
jgi:hypothetical protein